MRLCFTTRAAATSVSPPWYISKVVATSVSPLGRLRRKFHRPGTLSEWLRSQVSPLWRMRLLSHRPVYASRSNDRKRKTTGSDGRQRLRFSSRRRPLFVASGGGSALVCLKDSLPRSLNETFALALFRVACSGGSERLKARVRSLLKSDRTFTTNLA